MNLIRRFFSRGQSVKQPDIQFGRYSDIYKTAVQDKAYSDAEEAFESGQYLDACRQFLLYLRDESQNNVTWTENNGQFEFEFIQGSRRVFGKIVKDKISARTFLARANVNNVGFLRKLIEQNYSLKYSRYALDEANHITMITDSYLVDASPLKLYHAFRELAVMSDRLDDLLLDEFKNLEQVGKSAFEEISEAEKEIKYDYFKNSIDKTIKIVEDGNLEPGSFSNGYAFLLLQLLFKLDYLIRPEGFIMEELALLYAQYFSKDNKNTERKVMDLKQGLLHLSKREKADVFKELYRTKATFGFTKPADHHTVTEEIDKLLGNMQWFMENKHYDLALAIPSYIVGYSLYNYALPKPSTEYFHLFHQIMDMDYFVKLGFELNYRKTDQSLDKQAILARIREIASKYKQKYPRSKPDIRLLDFSSDVHFSQSYLKMIQVLNMDTVS